MVAFIAAILAAAPAVKAPAAPASLQFSELFERGPGELKPSARLLSLDGRRMRLVGFMAQTELPPRGGFYVCPRPVVLDEAGAGTGDLPAQSVFVIVRSARGREVPYRPGPLEVTGVLEVGNRAEQDGRVTAIRLTLDSRRTTTHKRPRSSPLATQGGTP